MNLALYRVLYTDGCLWEIYFYTDQCWESTRWQPIYEFRTAIRNCLIISKLRSPSPESVISIILDYDHYSNRATPMSDNEKLCWSGRICPESNAGHGASSLLLNTDQRTYSHVVNEDRNYGFSKISIFPYHSTSLIQLVAHRRKRTWWRHRMEIIAALLANCAGNSPVPGEFPAQRPVTRSSDVFFDLRLNKRLSKQSWGWWFETLSRSLCRHCNYFDWYIFSENLISTELYIIEYVATEASVLALDLNHIHVYRSQLIIIIDWYIFFENLLRTEFCICSTFFDGPRR